MSFISSSTHPSVCPTQRSTCAHTCFHLLEIRKWGIVHTHIQTYLQFHTHKFHLHKLLFYYASVLFSPLLNLLFIACLTPMLFMLKTMTNTAKKVLMNETIGSTSKSQKNT